MHGVTIKLKSRVFITSTSGKALDIVGTASLMVLLAPIGDAFKGLKNEA